MRYKELVRVVISVLCFFNLPCDCLRIPFSGKIYSRHKVPPLFSVVHADAVIVGSGPAGLATAIMLARRGYTNVNVFDKLPEPPPSNASEVWNGFLADRSYNIGLSGRGQKALTAIGMMNRVDANSAVVIGRKDWTPESAPDSPVETIFTGRSYLTKCIQRDRLAACLLEGIREEYSDNISVHFNVQCVNARWELDYDENEVCILSMGNSTANSVDASAWEVKSRFVIGTDGSQSVIRECMAAESKEFKVKRYQDSNVRVYRTIPMYLPREVSLAGVRKKWPSDVNYSCRTKSDINFDALPTKEGLYLGVLLYRPWDEKVKSLQTAVDTKSFFQNVLPMFSPWLKDDDLAKFALKNDSKLPLFQYAGPVLHRGQTTCLLGDAIHTVKPYFGLGVNSAFEDVLVLDECLNVTRDKIPEAIRLYSAKRAKEAEALVSMSRKLDGGFLTFVLPLIIDSVLSRIVPKIFGPNTISLLQNENLTFTQVRWRKRIDRVLQVALLFTSLAAVQFCCNAFLRFIGLAAKSLNLPPWITAVLS